MQIYKKIAIFVGFKEKMMKKTIFYVILLLIAFQAIGCKKNENTTTTPSLLGLDIDGEYDNFMGENSDIWVQADVEDLYVSNGSKLPEKIGIYFTVSSNVGVRDTVTRDVDASNPRHYIHLGEAGNYTIQCFAYGGESVYNASASIAITAVTAELMPFSSSVEIRSIMRISSFSRHPIVAMPPAVSFGRNASMGATSARSFSGIIAIMGGSVACSSAESESTPAEQSFLPFASGRVAAKRAAAENFGE